jgi:hypothetical protein
MEGITEEVVSITEEGIGISKNGLSRGRKDRDISDQEEGDGGTESDFEFLLDAFKTDLDSEPDLSLDNDEIDTEEGLDNTVQSNSSLVKAFLEKTWGYLCDYKKEENTDLARELVFSL